MGTLELSIFSFNQATSSTSNVFSTFGNEFIYFSYVYPAGSYSSATVYLEDIEFSNFDSGSLAGLNIRYKDFGGSADVVESCGSTVCSSLSTITNTCDSKGSFSLSSPCDSAIVYFAIGVALDSSPATVVTGTTHTSWTNVDVPEADCTSIVPNLDFYVNSPEFLFVAVREVSLSSSVSININACDNSDSCTANENTVGNDASCFVDGSNCNPGRCLEETDDDDT